MWKNGLRDGGIYVWRYAVRLRSFAHTQSSRNRNRVISPTLALWRWWCSDGWRYEGEYSDGKLTGRGTLLYVPASKLFIAMSAVRPPQRSQF
jgi:hypothetical protein